MENIGESEERVFEKRLYDLERTVAAGFTSTHERHDGTNRRLDAINGSVAATIARLDKLEDAALEEKGAERERTKWEIRQQKWHEQSTANLKWFFGAGMTVAGVISGVVFGILQLV